MAIRKPMKIFTDIIRNTIRVKEKLRISSKANGTIFGIVLNPKAKTNNKAIIALTLIAISIKLKLILNIKNIKGGIRVMNKNQNSNLSQVDSSILDHNMINSIPIMRSNRTEDNKTTNIIGNFMKNTISVKVKLSKELLTNNDQRAISISGKILGSMKNLLPRLTKNTRLI